MPAIPSLKGKFFKYTIIFLSILIVCAIVVTILAALPILTGGRFQNPISKLFLKKSTTESKLPAPKICLHYKIPSGKQEFDFSYGKEATGPKIGTAIIDPIDPTKDQTQTITLTIKNGSPVTHASATLTTDNMQIPADFRLIQGSNTDGTWQLTWRIQDSYNCRYSILFDLRSLTGNYNDGLHIR